MTPNDGGARVTLRRLGPDGAWRDHERWAITREMTDFPPVDPHPTLPAR
jgi:hypothetical protein